MQQAGRLLSSVNSVHFCSSPAPVPMRQIPSSHEDAEVQRGPSLAIYDLIWVPSPLRASVSPSAREAVSLEQGQLHKHVTCTVYTPHAHQGPTLGLMFCCRRLKILHSFICKRVLLSEVPWDKGECVQADETYITHVRCCFLLPGTRVAFTMLCEHRTWADTPT